MPRVTLLEPIGWPQEDVPDSVDLGIHEKLYLDGTTLHGDRGSVARYHEGLGWTPKVPTLDDDGFIIYHRQVRIGDTNA